MTPRLRYAVALCALVGIAVLGIARPALAEMGDVSVGGVWVCRLTRGIGSLSLEDRMIEIERRLAHVLSTPKYRSTGVGVTVRPSGRAAHIVVGDAVIITVTDADAEGTTVTPVEMARQWAARLARGLNRALPDANIHVF